MREESLASSIVFSSVNVIAEAVTGISNAIMGRNILLIFMFAID